MVTIFTPTYNRGYIIGDLYRSLKRQTAKAFEWVVVDDGSTDGTEEMFHRWMEEENAFPIIYQKFPHGGKHRAFNAAVSLARGNIFMPVDSDDYLSDHAVEKVIFWMATVLDDSSFAGIAGLRAHFDGTVVGGSGIDDRKSYLDATNLERTALDLDGDKAEAYKTDVLRRYPFPAFDGEDFVSEGTVWNAIAKDGLKLRWYREAVYYCEYREDGLSHQGLDLFFRNPLGWIAYIASFPQCHDRNRKFLELFFMMNDRQDVMSYLRHSVGETEFSLLASGYRRILCETVEYFDKNDIHAVSFYGAGAVGRCFLRMANRAGFPVMHGVDRNPKWNGKKLDGVPVYLPVCAPTTSVNAIVVTMQRKDIEVIQWLESMYKYVLFWKDLESWEGFV